MGNDNGIAMKFWLIERRLYEIRFYLMANAVYRIMQLVLSCTIPYTVIFGRNCRIPHFHGIVIHQNTEIGNNCTIYQNVTIGGRNGKAKIKVGDNCVIGAGAVLLGELTIGSNVNIGANAVVLESVPDNCTVVGVPAKVIKNRGL